MTKDELQEAIVKHIELGEQILLNEQNNSIYDGPILYPGRVNQFWTQYKAWREGFDQLLDKIISYGASLSFQPLSADQEARNIFSIAEQEDIYRDTRNALKTHINELKGIQV